MNAQQAIRSAVSGAEFIVNMYLADLTDADMLVRPVPGANHIKWQLGHLMTAEHGLINEVRPGSMPPLPAGFAEKYTKETASSDDPKAFHSKEELLKIRGEQRTAALKALESVTDTELDQPCPEKFRSFLKTVADVYILLGNHDLMHAGQWAVVRRKLGKPPLF